jgi:hypothetical protein
MKTLVLAGGAMHLAYTECWLATSRGHPVS